MINNIYMKFKVYKSYIYYGIYCLLFILLFFTCKLLKISKLYVNNSYFLLFYCLQFKIILLIIRQLAIK